MLIRFKWWLFGLSAIIALGGAGLWLKPETAHWRVAAVLLVVGLSGAIASWLIRSEPDRTESGDIKELGSDRRRELMRGTSLFLRDSKYRYSIRLDNNNSSRRPEFNAVVNTIKLGFVPAVITDNTSDRQDYGYVAFVHDGARWRGPGLPCPSEQTAAVEHAAKCVSPLATEEETRFEG